MLVGLVLVSFLDVRDVVSRLEIDVVLRYVVAVALIVVRTGTSSFVDAVGSPIWAQDPAFTSLVAVLVAMAGFSKAAQFPFHLWLPDAMAWYLPISAT